MIRFRHISDNAVILVLNCSAARRCYIPHAQLVLSVANVSASVCGWYCCLEVECNLVIWNVAAPVVGPGKWGWEQSNVLNFLRRTHSLSSHLQQQTSVKALTNPLSTTQSARVTSPRRPSHMRVHKKSGGMCGCCEDVEQCKLETNWSIASVQLRTTSRENGAVVPTLHLPS